MPVIHELIRTENDIERLRELLVEGENPNGQDSAGRTPLHIAVMKFERDHSVLKETLLVIHELINYGAEVNLADYNGCGPLHLAAMCRGYELIETLMQFNGDINRIDGRRWTALHYASVDTSFRRTDGFFYYKPELRVVNLLLRYNPDRNIRNQDNESPLMLAVRFNELQIVRALLLNENKSQNLQDSEGNTIMHFALGQPEVNVDVVLELARQGCSFKVSNLSGKTPRNSYLEKLKLNHPLAEVEKAKPISKIVLLDDYVLSDAEEKCLRVINKENRSAKFLAYLNVCYQEIMDMDRHILAPDYPLTEIARRGAFPRKHENDDPISPAIFDKVLHALIKGRYPAYCEKIAAGIYKRYMNEKFVEMCCRSKTGIDYLYPDALYLVSFHLSQYEMVNMMIACSDDARPSPRVQCFTECKGCSIS